MKYIKKFEYVEADMDMEFFLEEISLIKKISNFFKDNDLKEVSSVKIDGELYTLIYNKNTDEVYKIDDDGEEAEIMIGIKRYKSVKVYTEILKYLNSLTEEDIKIEKAKVEGRKFNL